MIVGGGGGGNWKKRRDRMILSHITPNDIRLFHEHPWICIVVIIVLGVVGVGWQRDHRNEHCHARDRFDGGARRS